MRGNKLNTMGAERKKPDTKEHILCNSIYVKTKTVKTPLLQSSQDGD